MAARTTRPAADGPQRAVPPPSRTLRTAVAVSVATAIGGLGHLLAGGALSSGALAVALCAATVPAWLSTGRERGWAWIAALQIGNQQLVHGALSSASWIGRPVLAEQMHHDLMPAAGMVPHDLMLPAHVLAGLVTAVALRAGERHMWAQVRRITARIRRGWRRLTAPPPVSPRRAASSAAVLPDRSPRLLRRLLRHAVVLRGPPPATS